LRLPLYRVSCYVIPSLVGYMNLEAPISSRIRRPLGSNDRGRRLGIVESCEALALIILQHASVVADVEKVPQFRVASVAPNNKGSG
jgi:hypothetical protein